jgi:hypothetical protein
MDRSFEQVRTEVLELDDESQRRLVEEIEHRLEENDSAWREEIARRLDEHRRGDGTYVSKEQMMDMAEKMISAAEQKRC